MRAAPYPAAPSNGTRTDASHEPRLLERILPFRQLVPVIADEGARAPERHDLEAQAVRILEERRVVVGGVLGVDGGRGGLDAEGTELARREVDVGVGRDAEAEVVQPWRIRVVRARPPRRPERVLRVRVEVV